MSEASEIDRRKLPPGPRFAPYQTLRYMADARGYTRRMRARYGDLFTMPAMNGLLVIACTAQGAREILKGREEDFYVGFGREAVEPLIGSGSLLLLDGARHQRDRKILSPTFHGARMRAYADAMQQSTLRRAQQWKTGQVLTLQREMQAISMDVIIEAVIGASDDARKQALRRAITLAVDEINPAPIFFKFLQHEFGGLGPWATLVRRLGELDELVYSQIRDARSDSLERDDVLWKLLQARDEGGQGLSDREIRDHLLTLLVAGHETTTTSLSWVLYEVFRHPDVYEWLKVEIASLGSRPTPDALAALPALDAVCRESLRLHPVLAEFFRTVRSRFEIGGYEVPAGGTLAASILEIHSDAALYPEPEAFRPRRFLDQRFAPHEFAAFGGGHRHCVGAAFAMAEMKIVLGTLLQGFELEATIERPLRTVRRHAALAPERGAPMRVVRRLERYEVPAA